MILTILLKSKINISLCTDLIFTDESSVKIKSVHNEIFSSNYSSINCFYLNIWGQTAYSNGPLTVTEGH